MRNDPSGSQWRKWDFHFHTPASFDYEDKFVSDEAIIAGLRDANVAAVAITDHHVMDVERLKNLQILAGDELTVFPGIEFRSELGGSEKVHFIGIFPEDCDIETVWDKLKGKLDLTPQDVAEKGDDSIYVQFVEAAKVIHELGGLVTVHAGKKSNSIEGIANTETFKMAFKKDLAERHVDLLEVKSDSDVTSYRKIVFPQIGFRLPVVVGSDNHNINEYDLPSPCWIKADCTFAGLCHVLHEPDDRVFIGDAPPSLRRVAANKTKYLRSVAARKRSEATIAENWFECVIPLNHGLIAVVGNKGSGKSALADVVGLLGNTKNSGSFSFLSSAKFCQPKANKAEHFEAEAVWETGLTRKRKLSESIDAEEIETVNYIPQDYLEGVCNELSGDSHAGFGQALRQVIYSHVSEADRLGFGSLDELLAYKTKETTQAIDRHKGGLTDRIRKFLRLLEQASPSHRKSLTNQLEAKRSELAANETAKPAEVPKPENDAEAQKQIADVEKQLTEKEALVETLAQKVAEADARKGYLSKQLTAADKLLKRMDNLDATVATFREESAPDCDLLDIDIDGLLTYALDRTQVVAKKDELTVTLAKIVESIGTNETSGLTFDKAKLEVEIKELRDSLDAPNRRYQEYLSSINKWSERHAELVGKEDVPGTVKHFEQQLKQLDELPAQIDTGWNECLDSSETIYCEIEKLADAHRTAFGPVQHFVENHPLAKDRFELKFEAALVVTGFNDRFLAYINQGRKGSFCGVEEGRERLDGLVQVSEFETKEGLRIFLDELKNNLTNDLRQTPPSAVSVNDQLSKGQTGVDLLSYILGLEYLKPQVTLRWAGKDIEQLSPGERGTLLLVFYLLIDKSDTPLVIDQPEENLDNQTVVDFLVPSVKEAKERRQIILVTHNPNLAVVCDADQVICASLDKNDGNRVSYVTGAIENPIINQQIVDILEGTRLAFDNRDGKYHAEKSQARPRHRAFPTRTTG